MAVEKAQGGAKNPQTAMPLAALPQAPHPSEDASARLDRQLIASGYEARKHIYEALLSEAVFILRNEIEDRTIKIHLIEQRVKNVDSIINKAIKKEISAPLLELTDIVGCRVICLFRSDVDKIGAIIEQSFKVISADNKIADSPDDSFGYMSVHYIVKMKDFTGPRYEKIKDMPFEIQVRTISMHAWAAISHHLDYKGEWDVPAHLKKALNALSGLFYVADDTFERFYVESEKSKKEALERSATAEFEINLDTLTAYIAQRFPTYKENDESIRSTLVQEIKAAGYSSIRDIDSDLSKVEDALENYHKLNKAIFPKSMVGITRLALSLASDAFIDARERLKKESKYGISLSKGQRDRIVEARKFIRTPKK